MRHSLAVFLLLTLTACSLFESKPDLDTTAKTSSVEEMYFTAKKSLDEGNYEDALKEFESLQSHYPYGRFAQQSQLEIAFIYYKQKEAESAISAADRFIKQYPNNTHVDYAYYVKGLANFNQDIGMFGMKFGEDTTERDPKASQESFSAFKDLVTRFPASKYADDSRLRMQYLLNSLAKYDIHVASYYLRRGADVAAVNRATAVLSLYPNSPSSRDALVILVKAYDALGMKQLRDDAQRVLNMNYPLFIAGQANQSGDKTR